MSSTRRGASLEWIMKKCSADKCVSRTLFYFYLIHTLDITESMTREDVRRRELAPLQKIADNYEKIVLSLDPGLDSSYDGIKSLNLITWLLQ